MSYPSINLVLNSSICCVVKFTSEEVFSGAVFVQLPSSFVVVESSVVDGPVGFATAIFFCSG